MDHRAPFQEAQESQLLAYKEMLLGCRVLSNNKCSLLFVPHTINCFPQGRRQALVGQTICQNLTDHKLLDLLTSWQCLIHWEGVSSFAKRTLSRSHTPSASLMLLLWHLCALAMKPWLFSIQVSAPIGKYQEASSTRKTVRKWRSGCSFTTSRLSLMLIPIKGNGG